MPDKWLKQHTPRAGNDPGKLQVREAVHKHAQNNTDL